MQKLPEIPDRKWGDAHAKKEPFKKRERFTFRLKELSSTRLLAWYHTCFAESTGLCLQQPGRSKQHEDT